MYHSVVKVKKIAVLSFSKLSFKVASAYMLPQSSNSCLQKVYSDMLNKNTWGVNKGGQVTKPIILICYKLLYVIQGVETSFGKVTSWPGSADIRVFGCTCLLTMLLLIGLALFTPKVFLFSFNLHKILILLKDPVAIS